jgi:uncharacterized protein
MVNKDRIIRRDILDKLKAHLSQKEISLIIGPRQVGKTTLMKTLIAQLDGSGERTLYLNLDIEEDAKYFVSQNSLLKKLQLESGSARAYVFIDEIQRKQDAGLFLKGLFDMDLPYKFIVSGSGSVELKEKVHESLAGRKRLFEMHPVSFTEFVDFRTDYSYSKRLNEYFSVEKSRALDLLDEYLEFGGYPRIVLSETLEEKTSDINEIYSSYIEKDIAYLLKVEKTDSFKSLIKLLAAQTGGLVNYSALSSMTGLSVLTIKKYLWYIERTYVARRLEPFYRNIRKETTKSPVCYFYDLGLRNFALGMFGISRAGKEKGFSFQNFIFNILDEKLFGSGSKTGFWRTKDKAEVDFVVERSGEIIPLEAKFSKLSRPEIGASFRNFIKRYSPRRAFIVNLSLKQAIKIDNTEVVFMPYSDLLFFDL